MLYNYAKHSMGSRFGLGFSKSTGYYECLQCGYTNLFVRISCRSNWIGNNHGSLYYQYIRVQIIGLDMHMHGVVLADIPEILIIEVWH